MSLSSEQLHTIRQLIEESAISRSDMRENLIDHICCAVEDETANGQHFDLALTTSLENLAPNGFNEIEIETHLILNTKSINMKKLAYSLGLLFSICASLSLVFKTLHLTGANELLLVGFGGLAVIFIPLLLVIRQSAGKSILEKTRERLFLVSLMFLSVGAILKLFHLAGSEAVLLTGIIVFCIGFLPLLFLKMYKEAVVA